VESEKGLSDNSWLAESAIIRVHLSSDVPDAELKGRERYQEIKEIGNGSFAKVYLCRCKVTNRVFAMKKMDKRHIKKTHTV